MEAEKPLYNSRIIKAYLEYLNQFFPDLDINSVLEDADITRHGIEDSAHWFTQKQVDRFHDRLVEVTKNNKISR